MEKAGGCFPRRSFLAGGFSLGAFAAVGAGVPIPKSKIGGYSYATYPQDRMDRVGRWR